MPPHGRPPTRSFSRTKSANVLRPTPEATPKGHVQTLLERPVEVPTEAPAQAQPQSTGHALVPVALPAQLQARSQLLDVLERRIQGIIQQEMVTISHVTPQQNLQRPPRSTTQTAVSWRHPHPAYYPVQPDPVSEPVAHRKQRGKPPTPHSPPVSISPTFELPSFDSSSWESSPKKKSHS